MASAVFFSWPAVKTMEEFLQGLIKNTQLSLQFFFTKLYFFQNLSIELISKIFFKLRKFRPSEIYSYLKKRV